MAESNKAFSDIEYTVNETDGFAKIVFNRATRGNSITPQMGLEIKEAISLAEKNLKVRAIILTGAGKFFCTGMDLGASNQNQLEADLQTGSAAQNSIELFESIKRCTKPTIALINGPIYGGGCGIFFVCDIRIAVENSFLCFAEVKRGLVPALISAYIVPQLGEYLSNVYMMTGMKLYAKDLFQRGLISRIVAQPSDLENESKEFIKEIRGCGIGAVSATKENVQFCASHPFSESKIHVQSVFSKFIHSEEAMYGLSCFMQKTQPDWQSFAESQINLSSKL